MSAAWLNKLFRPSLKQIADFSFLGVDMHSHLLPGIDDGAHTMEESVELILGLVDLGFTKLVTTPHIMIDGFVNTAEIINNKLKILRERLAIEAIDIQIEAAAEYFLDEGFLKDIKNNELLSFGPGNYVLFELSYINKPGNLEQVIFDLCSKGYTPVLAHAERYTYYHAESLSAYRNIINAGALLQTNILSIDGLYKSENRYFAELLVKQGLISFLGTDLHHIRQLELLRKSLKAKYVKFAKEKNKLLNSILQ